MKHQRLKDIVMGAVVATLIVGVTPTAFAKVSSMSIPVNYNNIKVVVDGKELKTDKEPFTYEGTTYLPVRAVAEAVGKEVKWDSATQTVTLSDSSSTSTLDPGLSTKNKFEQMEEQLAKMGIQYEEIAMAANLIGAVEGKKYKTAEGNIELYRFEGAALEKVTTDKRVTLGGFGDIPVVLNGDFAMIITLSSKKDTVTEAFSKLL